MREGFPTFLLAVYAASQMRSQPYHFSISTYDNVLSSHEWEQSIIYLGAIILGLAFGVMLTSVTVPNLVFSGLPKHSPLSTLSISDF